MATNEVKARLYNILYIVLLLSRSLGSLFLVRNTEVHGLFGSHGFCWIRVLFTSACLVYKDDSNFIELQRIRCEKGTIRLNGFLETQDNRRITAVSLI